MMHLAMAFVSFTAMAAEAAKPAQQVEQDVKGGKAVLLDVREADEIKSGIATAAIWLPTSSVDKKDSRYQEIVKKLDKAKTVYVYCAVGGRSGALADALKKDGYTAVNLGGFADLKKDGIAQQPAADAKGGAQCPYLCEPRK